MHLKNTAKFGVNNNESIMDRFHTEITQHIGRSQLHIQPDQSQMNLADLDLSRQDFIAVNAAHKIPQEPGATYRCDICDRLRAICPYKNYKTYQYCQKCTEPAQNKRTRPRIFSAVNPGAQKDLNSTFNETKGHSTNGLSNGLRQMQEVNKVRFVQTNNVYPLKPAQSTFREENTFRQDRKRIPSAYELRPSGPVNHQVIKEQLHIPYQVPNVEEIIFYPVIHNKLVYRSASKKESQWPGEESQMARSRYHSHYGGNKKKGIEKAVSDFLQTTNPDEVLTPSQFKKLADSIYRETNPNVEEETGDY